MSDSPQPQNFTYPEKNSERIISDEDLWVLSYYRSSELAGSLLMGRMARRATDDELRSRLTWHFAEEARHAWRWTEIIRKLGADPLPITETYQSNYFTGVGIPKDDLELLAITQVFERRVARHFSIHRRQEDIDPQIKEMLGTMCCDEGPHVMWVRAKLEEYSRNGRSVEVREKLELYQEIDKEVYSKEIKKFEKLGWKIPEEIRKETVHDGCEAGCLHAHT